MPETIILPLHQVGEPAVDYDDLWAQLGVPHERHAETVRRLPAPTPRWGVTVNGRSI